MLEEIKNPEKKYLYDSVTIIYDTLKGYKDNLAEYERKCKHYVICEYSNLLEEPETLKQVETWFLNHYGKMMWCMVISKSGLSGEIFQYGNHGNYWEKTGDTCGYA